jgi:autophagy-related protein 2
VSPVRSLVNVGSGVADLVLLPIAQYKKDKRLVRGVQKGTTSFVKSTAMEAIKLGARLATGTQVILEQAESVLGGQGQFRDTVTTEALQSPQASNSDEDPEVADLISKYADQPQDVHEGVQSAYRSLTRNFNSAAQTILAVPMEVYERSGNEASLTSCSLSEHLLRFSTSLQGPVRAIVRAVPIAVLKPMIGASEAVSKTLFGLRNSMDPEVKHENEAKYKQR